jgi:hypothetical protein
VKKLAALVALSMALGIIAAPVMAADKDGGGLERAVDGSLIVTRVGGVGAGMVLGTPVAIVRDVLHMYRSWTPDLADKVGGKDFGPSVALVSIATVPASLVWGGVCGTYHGSHNAITKGFNEPFHPDSFSLGKDYEE